MLMQLAMATGISDQALHDVVCGHDVAEVVLVRKDLLAAPFRHIPSQTVQDGLQ